LERANIIWNAPYHATQNATEHYSAPFQTQSDLFRGNIPPQKTGLDWRQPGQNRSGGNQADWPD